MLTQCPVLLGNSLCVHPDRGDSRIYFIWWHGWGQDPVRGGHGKSHVPQHKWDDIKRALHNLSFYK